MRIDHISPSGYFGSRSSDRRICAYAHGEAHHQQYPLKLGYAWIWPRQWVLVHFHGIRRYEGDSSDLGSGNGNLSVMMGNGANTTVDESMFTPRTCGRLVTLQNESGNAIEAVVTA